MTATCPLCQRDSQLYFCAKDYNREISQECFHYFRCPSCSLIFLSPIPNDLGKYYPHDYYPIPQSASELAKTADVDQYKIDIVKQFASRGRLLEIGPAYGSFLYLAKQAGFDAEAIEMDADCCSFIREKIGAKAIQSNDPSDVLRDAENYDVIALWHVIEHLPDPWKTLDVISTKLNPGGVLVIAAPNPDAFQFRVLGRFWPHVDAPRHLQLIPLPLLGKQMVSAGLKFLWSTTTDRGTLGWNAFGWSHFFSNFTHRRSLKAGLGKVGTVISIILGPIERRKDSGSAYTAVFKKEK